MAKYEENYTHISIKFNNVKEKDLIDKLNVNGNKSEYIKKLIRRDAARNCNCVSNLEMLIASNPFNLMNAAKALSKSDKFCVCKGLRNDFYIPDECYCEQCIVNQDGSKGECCDQLYDFLISDAEESK